MPSNDPAVEELFRMAGIVRGALWLLLILNENAAPVADAEGWRICWRGHDVADKTMAELLGTNVEKIAEWRERLSSVGMIRFVNWGVGKRIWLHKKYNNLLGSLKDEREGQAN
jgi:hypothetical protein